MSHPIVTIQIRPPQAPLPFETATILVENITDWSLSGIDQLGVTLDAQSHPLTLATALEQANIPVQWQSTNALTEDVEQALAEEFFAPAYPWPAHPTILALIPHWQCEPWLNRCLTSMLHQTHPLTHIVVIDDASPQPPLDIIKAFDRVTLLVAPERVGPYRLIQSVIDSTDYDAYLFQDADDWSSCDRIEILLKTARATGAELVGSQEIRVLEDSSQLQAIGYPLAVNPALAKAPGHPLLHPTSLVTRSLVQRLGGFATGLRFGGDTEFLLRAHWVARVVNSPHYCYFRRKRPDSLTTALETGLESPARQSLIQAIKQRAIAHQENATRQLSSELSRKRSVALNLDLRPLQTAPPIKLSHRWGPPLRWQQKP